VAFNIFVPTSGVSLLARPSPADANQPFGLNALVLPSTATGTVTFYNGVTILGSAPISGGQATLTNVIFPAGSYSLTANYSGDINNAAMTSPPISLVVRAVSSAMLTSSSNPSSPNQAVTFTATVTPATATGSVQFLDGASLLNIVPLSAGSAVYTTPNLAQGTHSISVQYSGDSNDTPVQSAAITQNVNGLSTISVISSQNPSTLASPVVFTATVTPGAATGTVQFLDGATVLGSGTLSGGSAQFTSSALAQGVHSITAVYGGDAANNGSTSAVLSQTVKQVTSISVASSLNPATVGQTVSFTVTLNPAATGTVQFLDGTTVLSTISVTSGSAVYSTSTLARATHYINAIYSGDTTYLGAQSSSFTETVNAKSATTTTLISPTNPSSLGAPVSLTANVSPTSATGTVQFLDGATVLGTATLAGGSAVFTATGLTQGTHPLTAVYLGDAADNGSTSAVVSEAIKLGSSRLPRA
jgi:large repetitive protein